MKNVIHIVLLALGLLATQLAPAQGTLYVSNLALTPTGSASIGSDAWVAQTFTTGVNPGGYDLNSIQLLIIGASGAPNGFNVSLYSKTGDPHSLTIPGDSPQSSLGNLSGVDPASAGLFTYTTSDIVLSSATYYFVVVTAATPVAQGAFDWGFVDYTEGTTIGPGDPWIIQDSYYSSANGSSWTWHPRQDVFQLGINATAVPEPTMCALLGLGLACLGFWRHRQRK